MTSTADINPAPGTMAVSITEDHPFASFAILSSALNKVRETAHMIEDRVRCLLMPDGPSLAELRILVVDDHPDAADSLAAVLELLGCSVFACYNGWTAWRGVETFQPDVCLLDLVMPDMGGLELGARLRTLASDRPLVLIATTALGDEDARRRTSVAGFDCHLTKPVDVSVLLESIARLRETAGGRAGDPQPPD
jgi:two-component system OmpR family response regulator